jgi:hypothetical protein
VTFVVVLIFYARRKPEILRDRDLAGELKDVWSAVQNFRDKEKAGISDIVVYTEFGPESAPELKNFHQPELPSEASPVRSEIYQADKLDQQAESQNSFEKEEEDSAADKEKSEDAAQPEKSTDESDSQTIEIEKLSVGDKKSESKHHESQQSNEKIVKIQNQKNKESQHTFFPKFLSSSKEKEAKDKEKDKEKEKEKDKDEQEPKTKTKKSLNFFRRNKSSASSPTHTSNNNLNNNQKSDSNSEH